MKMHQKAINFALAHSINLGRNDKGYYYIADSDFNFWSVLTTADSAIRLMKRYLNWKEKQ